MHLLKKLKHTVIIMLMLAGFVFIGTGNSAHAAPPRSQADCPSGTSFDPATDKCDRPGTSISPEALPKADTETKQIKNILNIVFGIVGALSLLMIVVSGLRYVLSNGDPARITKAKDGIVYALIGLLIALTAQAIVAFVADRL